MSDYGVALSLYGGFTVAAAVLSNAFLRVTRGPRAGWIASGVVVALLTVLGCALAIWVLPQLRQL